MNVLVDLLFIVPERNRGVRTYVDNLLAELNGLPDTNVTALTNRHNHDYYRNELGLRCHAAPVDGGNRLTRFLYQQAGIGFAAKSTGADVLFSPGYSAPVLPSLPTVVTLHDVGFRDIAASAPPAVRWVQGLVIPWAVRSAARIITVSQFSKIRIMNLLGIAGNKISVIHNGPLPGAGGLAESDWLRLSRKHGVRGRFFLSISDGRPHKNIERMVRAFLRMKIACGGDWQLVLVGHELDGKIREYVAREGFRDDVIATGFVSEAEKIAFLNNGFVHVFPSLYEGFGLPALEAQSCGLPLASSKHGSLPEVCGEGAVYFDAASVENIAAVLIELCRNAALRERIVRKGYENVRRFSWRRAAIATAAVLEGAAGGGGGGGGEARHGRHGRAESIPAAASQDCDEA